MIAKEKPRALTKEQREMLFDLLEDRSIRPDLINRLKQQKLYRDQKMVELLTLICRTDPLLGECFEAAWGTVMRQHTLSQEKKKQRK